jgi:hypothetical protein
MIFPTDGSIIGDHKEAGCVIDELLINTPLIKYILMEIFLIKL